MAEEINSQRIARLRREAGGINGERTDGASRVRGYSRFRQGPAARNFSNLDAFYANQRGAASSDNPAFAGMTPEDVAMEMKRRGETTAPGGAGIIPDTRLPPRARPTGVSQDTASGVSGPGNEVPLSPTGGYDDTTDQQDPFRNVQPAGTPPAATPPMGASTARQPVGTIDPSETPAVRRQMEADAAMGRSVNTTGTPGVQKFADTIPTQATNFRRMISSKYGTGTNVNRTMGQGPATTTDLMGRPAQLRQYLQDQEEVQRTKEMA